MTHPILFIHGMYMNGASWTPWIERARTRGYESLAPSWPHHEGSPAVLRGKIDPALGKLTFGTVTDHYKKLIDALPIMPVLIGHSIGGLQVQKLLDGGYGAAGVSISPAPPRGILSFDPTFLKANWPHANPFAGNQPIEMTKERFHFAFSNNMTRAESDAVFDSYVVPESRNVPRSTLTNQAAINFRAAGPPLLIVAGDSDHLTPLELVKKNYLAFVNAKSERKVEFKEFTGRAHAICNQRGWEEVADYCFDWLSAPPASQA